MSARFKVTRFNREGTHTLMADVEFRSSFEKAKEDARFFWMSTATGEARIDDQATGQSWTIDYHGVCVEVPAEKQLELF